MATEEPDAAPGLQAQLDELRSTTARLDQRLKEGQTSLLAAIKTLFVETQEFTAGTRRDFPQAALLGVVFAYLRPRIVLVLGSLAALVIAAGQVWLLARQNALIDQQNTLIREQGYALRAQTTATLLSGFDSDSNDMSLTQLSLLTAFGDIGLDSLRIMAKQPGEAGGNARLVLRGIADRITQDQALSVLGDLLAHDNITTLEAFSEATLAERSRRPTDKRGKPWGSRLNEYMPNYTVAQATDHDLADYESLVGPGQLASYDFMIARQKLRNDFASASETVQLQLISALESLYVSIATASGLDNASAFERQENDSARNAFEQADLVAQGMCSDMTRIRPTLSSELHATAAALPPKYKDIYFFTFVQVVTSRWCIGRDLAMSRERERFMRNHEDAEKLRAAIYGR